MFSSRFVFVFFWFEFSDRISFDLIIVKVRGVGLALERFNFFKVRGFVGGEIIDLKWGFYEKKKEGCFRWVVLEEEFELLEKL